MVWSCNNKPVFIYKNWKIIFTDVNVSWYCNTITSGKWTCQKIQNKNWQTFVWRNYLFWVLWKSIGKPPLTNVQIAKFYSYIHMYFFFVGRGGGLRLLFRMWNVFNVSLQQGQLQTDIVKRGHYAMLPHQLIPSLWLVPHILVQLGLLLHPLRYLYRHHFLHPYLLSLIPTLEVSSRPHLCHLQAPTQPILSVGSINQFKHIGAFASV